MWFAGPSWEWTKVVIGSSPNKDVYNLLFWVGVLGYSISLVRWYILDKNINIALERRSYMRDLFWGIPPTPCTAVPPLPGVKTKKIGRCIRGGELGFEGGHTAEGGIKLSNHTRGMVLAPEWLCEFYKNYLPKKHCLSKGQYLSDLTDRSK